MPIAVMSVVSVACHPSLPRSYPKSGYDNANTSHNPNETALTPHTVGGLRLAWANDVSAGFQTFPTVSSGTVFVSGILGLRALDARTGALRWTAEPRGLGATFDRSPTVVGDTAYIGALGDGRVYAFDVRTGAVRWSRYVDDHAVHSDPVVAHGKVYVHGGGYLRAFDAETGGLRFRTPVPGERSSPAVIGDRAYLSGFRVYLIDAETGAVLRRGRSFEDVSLVMGSERIYSVAVDRVLATNHNGGVQWTTDLPGARRPPALSGGRVFVGTSLIENAEEAGEVVALAARTGGRLWSGAVEGGVSTTPVSAGGVVYVGSNSGRLYAFAAAGCGASSCAPLWSADTTPGPEPVDGSVAVAGGSLYAVVSDGSVLAYRLPGFDPVVLANLVRRD